MLKSVTPHPSLIQRRSVPPVGPCLDFVVFKVKVVPYSKDFAVFPVSRHFPYSKSFSVLLRGEA